MRPCLRPIPLLLACLLASGASAGDASERVIVKFRPGTLEKATPRLKAAGAITHHRFERLDAIAVSLTPAQIDRLAADPDVLDIEPDPLRYPLAQTTPAGITQIQAPQAWAAGADGSGVLLCVIDSGLNASHEDFAAGAISGGYSFVGGASWDTDTCGHGTHVAGTALAADNTLGVVGAAPAASLYVVKIFAGDTSSCGSSYGSTTLAAAQKCVDAANAQGKRVVINMSLGGSTYSSTEESGFQALLAGGNVLSIAAAGNDGTTAMSYPASYPSVVSVAAVDASKALAAFSQRNAQVELAAPGVSVLSTLPWATASLDVASTPYAAQAVSGTVKASASGALVNGGLCPNTSAAWSGKIVLCQRSSTSLVQIEATARSNGAVGVLVYNNGSGGFFGSMSLGGVDYASLIPIASLGGEDGQFLVGNRIGQTASLSTVITGAPGNGYGNLQGTSMASPHVAGAAAAIWSARTGATASEVRSALTGSAEDLGSAGRDDSFGYGLVRTYNALQLLAPTDAQAPSAPTGLVATSGGSASVSLSWAASTDSGGSGLAGYRLERCAGSSCTGFAEVATTTSTSRVDSGLAPNTSYRYRVRAYDNAGNLSAYSAIAGASTSGSSDTTPPSTIGSLSAVANGATTVNLSWPAASDSGGAGLAGYRIERCSGSSCTGFVQVGTSTTPSYASSGLTGATTYRFRVRAYDRANNLGGYSPIVQATTAPATDDHTAPSAPTTLNATAVDAGRINVGWSGASDAGGSGLASYRIERCAGSSCTNFVQVGTSTTTTFASTGLTQATTYRFRIKSVDGAGNVSTGYSPIASATTPRDTTAPNPPTAAIATAVDAGRINVGWSGASDAGGSGLASYRIERCAGSSCTNFVQVGTSTTTTFASTGLTQATTYRFRIKSVDGAGNVSTGYSPIASATTPRDTTAPNPPTAAIATAVDAGRINVGWSGASDAGGSGLASYRIERCAGSSCTNFVQVGTSSTASFSNSGLSTRTTYRYRIRSVDGAGNLSTGYSPIATASTP